MSEIESKLLEAAGISSFWKRHTGESLEAIVIDLRDAYEVPEDRAVQIVADVFAITGGEYGN